MDYARSGDAREMPGIFYHNAQDILSLVTLTAHMCDLLVSPLPADSAVPGEDLYGLARLFQELDSLSGPRRPTCRQPKPAIPRRCASMAMRDLAYLLKRQERRVEALAWWQRLVEIQDAVYACEELAKHYEWHDWDLPQALGWTEQGIALAGAWPAGAKRRETLADLEHRLQRLQRKLAIEQE